MRCFIVLWGVEEKRGHADTLTPPTKSTPPISFSSSQGSPWRPALSLAPRCRPSFFNLVLDRTTSGAKKKNHARPPWLLAEAAVPAQGHGDRRLPQRGGVEAVAKGELHKRGRERGEFMVFRSALLFFPIEEPFLPPCLLASPNCLFLRAPLNLPSPLRDPFHMKIMHAEENQKRENAGRRRNRCRPCRRRKLRRRRAVLSPLFG